jgi:protein-arginine kinase activator protein McsA
MKETLDCPFDFTSRCTMGNCDCKPKQETFKEAALKYAESNQYDLEYYDEGGYQGIEVESFAKKLVDFTSKWQAEKMYSEEEFLAFGKSCFYKGFEKAENDDANCYTAFREEIGNLLNNLKRNKI